MRGKKNDGPPPGARVTSAGRVTITIPYNGQRLSQNKIKADEPKSYANNAEAREGYARVLAFIAEEIDHSATVDGFWKRWTDEDDPEFGAGGIETPRRSAHSVYTYASHTRPFAEHYAERTLASLTEVDVKRWTKQPGYRPSAMAAIRTFLEDAKKAGLRSGENPAQRLTKLAQAKLAKDREDRPPVPTEKQSAAFLAHMREHDYPLSLLGWFLTGVRTGMRGGEIDGMQLRYLDRDTGVYKIEWQLHPRTRQLDVPKHESQRSVLLTPDVLEIIDILHPRDEPGDVDGEADFIWLNTFGLPWEDGSRGKWWEKERGGTTLREIVGDLTMYNATRHYWATRAVNSGEMTLWNAATLFGHKDGGRLIAKTYARRDEDAAIEAARAMNAKVNRAQIRRAA